MASITGIRTHRSSWYPSSGWTTTISDISISLQAGPTKNVDTSSTKHRLMTCLKIKTTSGSSIKYISKITITANGYRSSNTSGNLIARICSADPSANSTAGDSEAAMEALSISGVSQATASAEATAKDMAFSFVGTFNPNQEYYIIFYTAQASVMYLFTKNINSFSVTDVSVQKETYTITYNANGGSGTTSSQTVVQGESIVLRSNGFTAPTTAVHGITLQDSDGTALTASTYSTFKSNQFYCWRIGNTNYSEGASFTPTANTTVNAFWETSYTLKKKAKSPTKKDGYKITYDANGGTCATTSETIQDDVSYEHTKWVRGTTEFNPTDIVTYPGAATYKVKYAETTTPGSTTLPTPAYVTSTNLTVTYDYQSGTGSPASQSYTKTVTKAFKGWSTSSTATSGSTGTYKPSGNVKLYAIWGSSTNSYSSFTLPTPSRTGYNFVGWATSSSATSGLKGNYTPTSDISKLYAIWGPDGNVRLYYNSTDKYKMALVYVYAPSSTGDTKPWKLAIPYLYTSGTQPWKIIAG